MIAVSVPSPRDHMIPRLVNGYGDIALGNYTITLESNIERDTAKHSQGLK